MIIPSDQTRALAQQMLGNSSGSAIQTALNKGSAIVVRPSVLREQTVVVEFAQPTSGRLTNKEENALLDLCDAIELNIASILPTAVMH